MPSGIMWNARSQAAYHGYSHLSGIEMMSLLYMCVQPLLRTSRRSCGRQVRTGTVLVEPQIEVVVEILLGPQHARQRLAQNVGPVGIAAHAVGRHRVIERVGLGEPRREHRIEIGERLAQRRRRARRQPQLQLTRLAGTHTQV